MANWEEKKQKLEAIVARGFWRFYLLRVVISVVVVALVGGALTIAAFVLKKQGIHMPGLVLAGPSSIILALAMPVFWVFRWHGLKSDLRNIIDAMESEEEATDYRHQKLFVYGVLVIAIIISVILVSANA